MSIAASILRIFLIVRMLIRTSVSSFSVCGNKFETCQPRVPTEAQGLLGTTRVDLDNGCIRRVGALNGNVATRERGENPASEREVAQVRVE